MTYEDWKKISHIMAELETCAGQLEQLKNEQWETFDNLSERFKDNEKGQTIQDDAAGLQDALNHVCESVTALREMFVD